MALIQPSGIVSNISGKIGSVTIARNAGAPVARLCPLRLKPPTQYQIANQTKLAYMTAEWRNVPDDLKAQWHNLALQTARPNRVGISRCLSAYQMFVRETSYRLLSEQALDYVAPYQWKSQTSYPTYLAITPGISYLASFKPTDWQPNGRLLMYGSYNGSTISYGPTKWTFFGWQEIHFTTTFDFRTQWLTRLSELQSGSRYQLKLIYLPYYFMSSAPQIYKLFA